MKKLMIALIVLILIGAVNAKTIEKEVYEKGSVNVPGYNITILTIGGNQKSLASCINNEKYIINRKSSKILENLKVEVLNIYGDYARLKITYTCEECICDESCSNNMCFSQKAEEQKDGVPDEKTNLTAVNNNNSRQDNMVIISLILFMIVMILVMILLLARKKKHKKRGR